MKVSGVRFQVVMLLLVVAMPYFTGLRHGFVYDDHGTIEENPFLQDNANLKKALTLQTFSDKHVLDGQRPLVIVSYFAERALWGVRPLGYHVTNLVLHLAVVLALFFFLRRLADSPVLPLAVALLFGLHPILTEPVQCPAFREDLLLGLFGILYLSSSFVRGRVLPVVLQTLALALALGSKESAVILPVLLAWLWFCVPASRPAPVTGIASLSIGFTLVLAYVMAGFAHRPLQAAGGEWNGLSLLFPDNIWSAPCVFADYLFMLLWPYPLCIDHVIAPVCSACDIRFPICLGMLALWALIAWGLRRRSPLAALGMGWMVILFVPVANLLPLFNPVADRYVYFMAPGFALALGVALLRVRIGHYFVGAFALLYIVLSLVRLADWKDDFTLWSATVRVQPLSARAHTWLGIEMKRQGNLREAVHRFHEANNLNPHDVTAMINLAIIAGERGDLVLAEERLREAIRHRPDKADAHWNLAHCLMLQGRHEEAALEIRRTLKNNPNHPQARALVDSVGLKKF